MRFHPELVSSCPWRALQRGWCLGLSLAVLLAGTSGQLQAQMNPVETIVQNVGIDQRLNTQLPLDLKFKDETGRDVQLREYFNKKPVVLTLVYYQCPMLCTQVLNGFLKSSQAIKFQIGDDYDVVTVSFDPRETPDLAAAKKKIYVRSYRRPGAEEGWHFLTGDQKSIETLAAAVGYRYKFDERSQQYAHGSGIIVLTPDGRTSRYLYGIDYHPNDLRLALVESAAGKIGSPVDQILLLCFHYDPRTGKYGLLISRVLQFFGSLTAIALGSAVWVMRRQERQQEAAPVTQPELTENTESGP